jgi:Gpi18-like mannosyltransferase
MKSNKCYFSKGLLSGLLLLSAWIVFFIAFIPDRWGDSYSYLVSIRCSMDSNYGDFWFGKIQHPPYTFLLFCFGKAFQSDIVAAKSLSVITYSITLLMLYRIARKASGQRSAIFAVLLGSVIFVDFTQHGLAVLSESLMSALAISAVYYHLKDRPGIVGVLVGLSALVRSEFLFVFAAIVLIRILQRRWQSIIPLGLAIFPSSSGGR